MNSEFDDQQLENEIDRHLKGLPDLVAPRSLTPRTMQLISRPAVAWHSRSWSTWPASARAAFIVIAVGLLTGTVKILQMFEQDVLIPMFAQLAHWRAGVEWLWNAVTALAGAGAAVVDHASKEVIFSCILAMVLSYAACVGFGTLFVKLALSGPKKS